MRDVRRRRPLANFPPRGPLAATVLRGLAVAAVVALLAAADPAGLWACVPGALLLAAAARGTLETAIGVAVAVGAAVAAAAPLGTKAPLVALAVAAASAAILRGVRVRLEHERDAIRRSAAHDPLTGAFNRRGLDQRIAYEVARHRRECRPFAVIAIDLDGFKRLNDRFGHAAGDELLRDVAVALGAAVREQDTVARLGGDEFCVLAPETDREGGIHLAAKLERAIARVTVGLEALSGSVGLALFPDDGREAQSVLEAADSAQIVAKRLSRERPEQSRRAA